MPFKDPSQRKAYAKNYHRRTYVKKGYHATSTSFQKGYTMPASVRKKISDTQKGRIISMETREKMSIARMGIKLAPATKEKLRMLNLGKKLSKETRNKISTSNTGKKRPNWPYRGENHWSWIKDRTKIVRRHHNSTKTDSYIRWRTEVFRRDNWECRIADSNCKGQLEAHHILNWTEFAELRYTINNGITLCHAHHPRGRAKEKLLAPILQALIDEA